ncbi:MAG: hypothetical protein M3326_02500, partial [Actinomycetota bacterium]|nr:hypothetical protein [Actinomycetota bacterium]
MSSGESGGSNVEVVGGAVDDGVEVDVGGVEVGGAVAGGVVEVTVGASVGGGDAGSGPGCGLGISVKMTPGFGA